MGKIYRSRFKRTPKGHGIALQPRDLDMLDFIQRHERVTSQEILEYLQSSPSNTRKRLRDIFHELNLVGRPTNKRELAALAGKPLIYMLTPEGEKALGARKHVHAVPHGGWHEHLYFLTRITVWVELWCKKNQATFIHREELFSKADHKSLRMTVNDHPHIPDDLFGIDYDGKRRYFFLEADRATEDLKTIYRKIDAYDHIMRTKEFQKLGVHNPFVLLVTLSAGRALTILKYIETNTLYPQAFLLKAHPEFNEPYHKVTKFYGIVDDPWLSTKGEYTIARP